MVIHKVMSHTFSFPLALIVEIGLHLEVDNEPVLCSLGMFVVHGREYF